MLSARARLAQTRTYAQQAQGGVCAGQFGPQQIGQISQYLTLFLALFMLEFLKTVVDVHQEHGLEIAGFARL